MKRRISFFLSIDTIAAYLNGYVGDGILLEIIGRNRLYYRSFRNYDNPNEIGLRYDGSETSNQVKNNGNVLHGIPCSPGVVTGTARVIKDIFDAHRLEKGDILITRFTDPAWTQKFSLLSAVATETGGLLSHAAVISREYGMPSVLAVNGLTSNIKDGQIITIDGCKGEIITHAA